MALKSCPVAKLRFITDQYCCKQSGFGRDSSDVIKRLIVHDAATSNENICSIASVQMT